MTIMSICDRDYNYTHLLLLQRAIMFHFKKIKNLSSFYKYPLVAFFMGGALAGALASTMATQARAEPVLHWEMGGAAPLGSTTFNSQITGAKLDAESPVYFQTMLLAGYRFKLAPWFFIAPMGYYRLTAGVLEYRDINFPINFKTDINLFYQRQFVGNELAAGGDFGFIVGKWTFVPGFYIGVRNNLTKFTSRYFSDREIIADEPFRSAWQFLITPRFAVDYRIAPGVDMGFVVDYNFAPNDVKNGLLNFSIRAAVHF